MSAKRRGPSDFLGVPAFSLSLVAWCSATVKRSQGYKVNSPTASGKPIGEGVKQEFDITTMEREETDGEIKYLQEARAALGDIRTMLGANASLQMQIGIGVQARLDVNLDDMDERGLTGYMGELQKATALLLEGPRDAGQGESEIIDLEAYASMSDEVEAESDEAAEDAES